MNQQGMVRFVLQDTIENVHAYLVLHYAFPNAGVTLTATRGALDAAAVARSPGAADIYNHLRSDKEYFLNMSVIVSITSLARVSLTFLIATCSDTNYSKWH
jgi:hypothetical protein